MEALDLSHQDDWPEYFDTDEITRELWLRGDLEFLLWAQQQPIWDKLQNLPAGVVEFVVLCARQFGKSTVGVLYALSEAIKNRDCCILIVGPDINQTIDIVGPKMRFLCRTAPPGLIKPMASRNRYHVYHDLDPHALDYTEIVIAGMNENSSSQRGKTVHRILIEEIVDVPEQHFLSSVRSDLGPALLHSKDGKIIYLTTPPKYPGHPFVTETMVEAKLNDALCKFTLDDNVALTEQQRANAIKLAGGKHTVDYQREYECKVVRDGRVVCLPDFATEQSVRIFGLPVRCFMSVTIDWGGVKDKTVAVLHTYDYLLNIDMFWDCRVFEPNSSTIDILAETKKMMEGHAEPSVYIDAVPDRIREFNIERGFACMQAYNREPMAQCQQLNVKFQMGQAWIHPRCKFLIATAESAIWNKNKTDFDRTDALGHMDGISAMMYAITMQNRENPFGEYHPALDALHANQIPARSEDFREVIQAEEPIIPRAFGRHANRQTG
jgi:hypothetical protein